jgi:hypothetical protein
MVVRRYRKGVVSNSVINKLIPVPVRHPADEESGVNAEVFLSADCAMV